MIIPDCKVNDRLKPGFWWPSDESAAVKTLMKKPAVLVLLLSSLAFNAGDAKEPSIGDRVTGLRYFRSGRYRFEGL
jgi:hypothetical protein